LKERTGTNGRSHLRREAASGAPRGGGLGPGQFGAFISDLEKRAINTVKTFADNAKYSVNFLGQLCCWRKGVVQQHEQDAQEQPFIISCNGKNSGTHIKLTKKK